MVDKGTRQQGMKAERDYLLRHYYGSDRGRRPHGRSRIVGDDYRAIPIPVNLPTLVAGSCLIWRWALNAYGYGVVNGGLAHRMAYEQAHGIHPGDKDVLHLCHRRYCVQPAHLYLGNAAKNAEDREARFGKLTPNIFGPWTGGMEGLRRMLSEKFKPLLRYRASRWDDLERGADVGWPDPEGPVQLTFEPPPEDDCPGHHHVIPAGDAKLCSICGASDLQLFGNV